MSTLSVNFNSNYAPGVHVMYYRIVGAPSYSSATISCSGIGPCTATVVIPPLDNDSCDPVVYEGYIKPACCTDPLCEIPFTATFTPTETCRAVEFTCNNAPNCNNTPTGTAAPCITNSNITEKAFGARFTLCYPGGAAGVPAANFLEYTYADDPAVCCYDCVTVNASGAGGFQYLDCVTNQMVNTTVVATPTFCARKNSYVKNLGSSAVFSVTSTTCP